MEDIRDMTIMTTMTIMTMNVLITKKHTEVDISLPWDILLAH